MGKRWFRVTGRVEVSAYTYVQAEDATDAVRRAKSVMPHLCPYGTERSGVDPKEEAIVEEADGDFIPETAIPEAPPDDCENDDDDDSGEE